MPQYALFVDMAGANPGAGGHGANYMEFDTLSSEPTAPAAGRARLFFFSSGGKIQMRILFPSGASQIVCTEP